MPILFIILLTALITACISGIFGMAGGLIFMGVIANFMGVAEAMVVHGAVQSLSNSYRSFLLKSHIRWDILGYELIGALPMIGLLSLLAFMPQKGFLYIMLGLLPALLWLPRGWLQGDTSRPAHAILCGALVMALNLVAGVAGPALDFFYVKTTLTRHEIVSTKAVTMFASHLVKIGYFGLPLMLHTGWATLPPIWFFIATIPCVIIGTYIGTRILHRLSDIKFRDYTKYLVSGVGVLYLAKGLSLLSAI